MASLLSARRAGAHDVFLVEVREVVRVTVEVVGRTPEERELLAGMAATLSHAWFERVTTRVVKRDPVRAQRVEEGHGAPSRPGRPDVAVAPTKTRRARHEGATRRAPRRPRR